MNHIDPGEISVKSTSKLFEYEKISREIDGCSDIEVLKNMLKCYIRLYMKQQEVVTEILKLPIENN